jgi:hypothetical protein
MPPHAGPTRPDISVKAITATTDIISLKTIKLL